MSKLSSLKISGPWFIDEEGRKVILRGVNLGGSTKIPYKPNGATHIKESWPPIDLNNLSWIGRPFPRTEAKEHFTRLKAWGFNCLRFLTTWEAIEHSGPYQYDKDYLDYYAEMISMAGGYGFYVFVDPHQDVWSRVTGGDGAPLWLFDKVGLDYSKFDEAQMAINMQHLYDPNNEKSYPSMVWGENYKYFTNGTMWTLFFAGRDFAPKFILEDESTGKKLNIQDYMFVHYIGSLKQIAERVKEMSHVFGFDSLNEPHHGFIGHKAITRNLKMKKKKTEDPPLPGLAWTPVDGMFAAAGNSFDLEEIGLIIWKLALGVKRKIQVNPKKISIWKEGVEDFWKIHNVWNLDEHGLPVAQDNDYFRIVNGREVDYTRDYLLPFASRVAEELQKINPNWMIIVEDEPESTLLPKEEGWSQNTPKNMVNGFHWYDPALSYLKRFLWPLTIDITRIRPVWGLKGIQKMYHRQLSIQPKLSQKINEGNCPCLVGEFGCHMDLNNGKSYKKWRKGKRGWKVFKWQTIALDLMYNVLDELFLSSTQWNYTADNNNAFGDNWNQEDLSIFSRDQQEVEWQEDINSGGRAIKGFSRPYARRIAGDPIKVQFTRKSGKFKLEFKPDNTIFAPTEVYIPPVQYPKGYEIDCDGAEWTFAEDEPLLYVNNPTKTKVTLLLTRKK